ncbi:MAG: asparaginase [Rhizobiaceae bacterium]|nr:asparaginase [Rhizobiaceae bacterium]
MTDPVLVEVTRGHNVESAHRGAAVVCDALGKIVMSFGDIDRPVFPRSAVKSIQALPLVESGAADALGFSAKELALACASHSGEPVHVEMAKGILSKVGLDNGTLECGAHWPSSRQAMLDLARSGGAPLALHNNCSGKHAGFVCLCCHSGVDHNGYVKADHWLQETIRGVLEAVTGAPHGEENRGTDGCAIPTYAVPLKSLARGFARMTSGQGLGLERARAAKRLMDACMAEPLMVSGQDMMDLKLMQAAQGRIFVKTGAEGVYCAAAPELGLGVAVKCLDGATRGAEVIVAAILAKLFADDVEVAGKLTSLSAATLTNWNGTEVGMLRPSAALA